MWLYDNIIDIEYNNMEHNMNYAVTGNKLFVINEDRVVSRVDGKPTGLVETDKTITIALYGFIHEVEKEWLYWLSYFKLDMPAGYEDRVFDIEFKDYFSLRHMRVDPKMVVFKKPVYLIQNNNFRLVARFPNYAISTSGVTYNMKLMEYNKSRLKVDDYNRSTIIDQAKLYKSTEQTTHRLVAMTWIANDDYTKYYLVEHIDGNKSNCHYTNLRWVDHAYNNLAKSYQGLNTQAIAVKIRDIDTGEINSFPSLTEACRYMDRANIDTKNTPLRKDRIWHTKKGRYEIKYATDDTPWYYENKDLVRGINQKVEVIITKPDGSTTIIRNMTEFMDKAFGGTRPANSMPDMVRVYKKRNPEDRIEMHILDNYSKTTNYIAKHLKTNEILTATERKELTDKTGVSKSSIQKSIANDGAYQYNDWVFKIDNARPWSDVLNLNASNKPLAISVYDMHNKTTVSYPSIREAAKELDIDKKTIAKAVTNNNLLFGKFKFSMSA